MELSLIEGEIKILTFTFNIDIATATFTLICKDSKGNTKFTKEDADFDKTEIADKKVKVKIDASILDKGTHHMELKTVWSAESIDKSEKYILKIQDSLFD